MKIGKLLSLFAVLGVFFIFPAHAFAVDFTIPQTTIDANVLESGDIQVTETHIYLFDGEFNGITRDLIPKENTSIQNVQANENGQSLGIEKDESLYRIYRAGEDEKIEIELSYTIQNGIEVYEDMAQFYWPFFDKTNESTYEDMTLSIHPPEQTDDVIAFGYDEAFGKETIQEDGTVIFRLGEVPDDKKGDIRVAWDSDLFSTATMTSSGEIREELNKEQQALMNEATAKEERQEWLSIIGISALSLFGVMMVFLLVSGWAKSRKLHAAVKSEATDSVVIPSEKMSLPATISYMNYQQVPNEAIAASLLDLVRKGIVIKVTDQLYKVNSRKTSIKHENILIEWLFDEIGNGEEFKLVDLEAYTANNENHSTYQSFESKWRLAIRQEVKDHKLYQNKKNHRLLVGLSSLLLIPFAILFPMYDLFALMFISIALFFVTILYAIIYTPKTMEGVHLSYEWKAFKDNYYDLPSDEWDKWTEEDKMRAYLYGMGTNEKKMIDKNDELVNAFDKKNVASDVSSAATAAPIDIYMIAALSSASVPHFQAANDSASTASHSGTTSGGSTGGGVGGGGGGSGAF